MGVRAGARTWAVCWVSSLPRLRKSTDITEAPLLAASIFLDVLNVFLFFLNIFSGQDR